MTTGRYRSVVGTATGALARGVDAGLHSPVVITTDKPLVLLWIPEPGPYQQALERAGVDSRLDVVSVPMAEEPAADLLARCEAMLAFRAGAGLLSRMPRLRWIQTITAGVEGWLALPDLPATVTLTCARGTHRVQMPENILGALFHLTKPYAAIARDQETRRWTRRVSEPLAGKTLGILGLGAIGQEVARKAAALELTVIGTRREPAPMPDVARVLPPEGTGEVLGAADFVLLLLPVTPATRDFMDARRLAEMRATAWLLNFGRGELVVDADLVDAVKRGVLAGAVLDVFRTEPLPAEHPFWTTPGITVLPHLGGLHPTRDELVAALFVDNLRRFLDGAPLRHVVDRARGY
jgi:glyoxylate/hydroxypyruvate reductase